jgi:hypothetical protein
MTREGSLGRPLSLSTKRALVVGLLAIRCWPVLASVIAVLALLLWKMP